MDRRSAVGMTRREDELDRIIHQNGVDPVGNGLDQSHEEIRGGGSPGPSDELDEGEFSCPINDDIEVELAFGGLHFGNIDMEVADRVGFELPLCGLVAFNVGQAAMQ
jgi:hypothetical protein